jgi:hypothetical protein
MGIALERECVFNFEKAKRAKILTALEKLRQLSWGPPDASASNGMDDRKSFPLQNRSKPA